MVDPAYGVDLPDAANAYWSNNELAAIMRMPLSGCASSPLLTTSYLVNANVRVDTTSGCFTDILIGRILKGPLTGGSGVKLADGSKPMAVAIDETHVFWLNMVDDGSVQSVPKSGGRLQ